MTWAKYLLPLECGATDAGVRILGAETGLSLLERGEDASDFGECLVGPSGLLGSMYVII